MMPYVALAAKSFRNRRFSVALTVASIALSVTLLFGVERIRHQTRTSFTNTISGTDLIVGARTSPVQLLLASVFRLSDATNNLDWHSYQDIASHPAVAWTIPISLGDSHRGFRVVGTTDAYLRHLRYGRKQSLRLRDGQWFANPEGAVLGAAVARQLGYGVGDPLVIAHGSGEVSFVEHDEHPFQVVGILAPTGTPVDQSIHVSLAGMEAIHDDMYETDDEDFDPLATALAARTSHLGHDPSSAEEPGQLTAFFVGLSSRAAALSLQRMVNEYEAEALTATLPAAALQELWQIVSLVEKAMLVVSGFVVLTGLSGMLVALMTSLNERRREMAILRSVGARPAHIFGLVVGEAMLVTLLGIVTGLTLLYGFLLVSRPVVEARFGLILEVGLPSAFEFLGMAAILTAGTLVGFIPGQRMVRFSLSDGLLMKV